MLSALSRGMLISYGAFIGAWSIPIAPVLIATLLGTIAVVGIGTVEKIAIAGWTR